MIMLVVFISNAVLVDAVVVVLGGRKGFGTRIYVEPVTMEGLLHPFKCVPTNPMVSYGL
jgi:hypothetical protein